MAVWDVPRQNVDDVAGLFAGNPHVTLCYRRPRELPDWPYNLFCMVHAKPPRGLRGDRRSQSRRRYRPQRAGVLFSTRCFKQRGAVMSRSCEECG
jgi:hypothetical protein